jgi:hypothetical protein
MKKIMTALIAAAVLATPALADSKKKPKMSEAEAQRDASWRLVKNGLPLLLPSWLLPVYFHMHDKDKDKDAKKGKHDKM